MIVAAKDEEQAGIVLDCMVKESRHNPFLADRIVYGRKGAEGPGGRLRVMAGDAKGATGLNPDLILLDELTQWPKRDLFDSLWSGRQKRAGSVLLVITNAGELRSWQWEFLQGMRSSPRWLTWECPPGKQLASWQSPEVIAEVRKGLPPGMARRMIDNIWIDPSEESGWVTYAEALSCFDPLHLPVLRAEPGVVYKAGIDYGPKKDRTALSVVHRVSDNRVMVDHLSVWQGGPSSPVRITAVEDWIDTVAIQVYNADLVVDPYQMEATIQKYEHTRPVERFESRGGKANYEMAECLRSLLIHKRIKWGPLHGTLVLPDGSTETFADELSRLIVRPMSYGYRFDHTIGQHDDRTVAVGMASLAALREQTQGLPVAGEKVMVKPAVLPVGNPLRPGWDVRGDEAGREIWGRGVKWGDKSWRQKV